MVARAVMKAWQDGLGGPPPIGRTYRPESGGDTPTLAGGWKRPDRDDNIQIVTNDDGDVPTLSRDDVDDDPAIRVPKRDNIVPRRPGAAAYPTPDDSWWSSHHFWKGIVVGAGIVLLVKTAMAIQAPLGIDWYGF